MAKKKHNPYGEFVKAEYIKLKRSDSTFNKPMGVMFSDPSIKEKWESSDEETKQRFKDIATSKNDGTYDHNMYHSSYKSSAVVVKQEPNQPLSITDYVRPVPNNQVSVRPDMKVKPIEKPGLPGIPNSKKMMAKASESGQGFLMPDEMLYEHMASYRLFNRCKDIIYSKTAEELIESPMYSFSCNVMCCDNGDEDLYIPLEIAIYAYTIKDGVPKEKPVYLTFINPGDPPEGRMNEAKQHSEESRHKVPFKPMATEFLDYARKDYRAVYKEILDYVGEERTILCQHADYLQQIHGVLKWLAKKANEKPEKRTTGLIRPRVEQMPAANTWTVFDIKDYVYILGQRLNSTLPSDIYIEMLLGDEKFAYVEDYNCLWHNERENETKWCAKSCAKRTVNNLADLLEWFYNNYKTTKDPDSEPTKSLPLMSIGTNNTNQTAGVN